MVTNPGERHGARDEGPGRCREDGYVLLALLFALALLGIGMAALGTVWQTAAQREKEAELIFVGDQFRRAIESYYGRTPGTDKQFPRTLADLIEDKRFPMAVRHLRRIYADPLTGRREWGLVRDEKGGILAVHSLSDAKPLKVAGFPRQYLAFAEATDYQGWVFKASIEKPLEGKTGSTFVQGPEEIDPGLDNPPASGEVTPPAPETVVENRQLLSACEQARRETVQDCETLREQGDDGGWKQCTQAARAQFQKCLTRR